MYICELVLWILLGEVGPGSTHSTYTTYVDVVSTCGVALLSPGPLSGSFLPSGTAVTTNFTKKAPDCANTTSVASDSP